VEQEQSRIIVSCSGSEKAGNEVDHVFIIEDEEGNVIGFLTPKEFEERARNGTLPGKIAIADHDSCPACLAGQFGESLDDLKNQILEVSTAVELYKRFLESHSC
jgi:hypothetical protein